MFAGVGTGSTRLRDLIKSIRACKTAADERSLIAKECASIRTAIRDEEQETRQRNVAKLLFIHMLGYPTHFGQMECLKLIVSPHYSDKRVGYLGLMLLLDERQEVLMLVTNSLKNDLNHPNIYVVGLALCALANIASVEIARDTAPEVKKLLENNANPYVRKKAALCAIRIIRKVPELAENFVGTVRLLLNDRTHGCLTTGVTLAIELCELDFSNVEQFRKLVPGLVKLLKNLVLSGYAPEYDIGGTTDPFLQVKILKLMRIVGKGDADASEQMNDILAQVATNTENLRNVGNSILYECVQTILNIESESGLRVLAVNILGRFLINRDNNIRYVALNTLSQVVASDAQAVQRHRNIIVDCLKDNDVSIRRRALDLVYALVNETNVKMLVRELLNFLLISDIEFKPDLTAKLCLVTEKFAPTKRWHVDTILRIMSIAGQYVPDESCATMTTMIGQSPELQAYAVQKMFLALSKDAQQQPLVQVAAWTVGEFGDMLLNGKDVDLAAEGEEPQHAMSVTEANVLDLFEQVVRLSTTTEITKEYLLSALAKLTERFRGVDSERIASMIRQFRAHLNAELQQRACEFDNLLRLSQVKPELRGQLLQRLPPLEGTPDKSNSTGAVVAPTTPHVKSSGAPAQSGGGIFNIDELLTPVTTGPAVPSSASTAPKSGNILDELFAPVGGSASPAPGPMPAAAPKGGPVDIMEMLTGGVPMPASMTTTPGLAAIAPMTVYNKNGIMINFELTNKGNQTTRILATSSNLNPAAVTSFSFQAAVPRYCKLEFVRSPSGDSMPPMGKVTQEFDVTNTLQGQKPLLLKMKLDYIVNGTPVAEVTDVSGFPATL